MNNKTVIRWLAIAGSVPIGAFIGFNLGYDLCYWILTLQDKGNSHHDLITVVSAGGLGMCIGLLLMPICVWYFTRSKKR